jgi:hypothetical protein
MFQWIRKNLVLLGVGIVMVGMSFGARWNNSPLANTPDGQTNTNTWKFDPGLFEPRQDPILGVEEIELDAEEIEEMRKGDIRQCTRDLLLVERARDWLLEDEE